MILSIVDFCCFLHGTVPDNLARKLQICQNKALRICLNEKRDILPEQRATTEYLHQKYKCDYLDKRSDCLLLSMMFKLSKNRSDVLVKNPRTRSDLKIKFKLRKPKTTMYKRSAMYRGKMLWNKLSRDKQNITDKMDFKRMIRGHLN